MKNAYPKMNMGSFMKTPFLHGMLAGLPLLPMTGISAEIKTQDEKRPNIVLVVSDDGGWADFGFNGCTDFKTPHLDKLAAEGTIFRTGYVSASVCSPSRAGLLTGRSQTRFGHEFNIIGKTQGLPVQEKMLAERLKQAGYATAAFGKWHLGEGVNYRPSARGFEYSYTFLGGSRGYKPEDKLTDNARTMRLNDKPQILTEYLTDAIARHAEEYIRNKKAGERPFFMYVAFNCPHSPLQAKPDYEKQFPKLTGARKTIAAMQTSLDEGVGKIAQALQDTGHWENTIFWFINDNGGATYGNFDNGGLRNYKGSLFDGGIKVAWFGHFPKGMSKNRICEKPVISLDIAATSLAAAQVPEKDRGELEGKNLLPYLTGAESEPPSRPLFWRQRNIGAVRNDDWKLISIKGKPMQLFNLAKDPFEKNNLVDKHPNEVEKLTALYQAWDKKNVPPLWRGDEQDRNLWMYEKDAPWDIKKGKPANKPMAADDEVPSTKAGASD